MGPKWHCGCGSSAIPEAGSVHLPQTKSTVKGDQKTTGKGRREGFLQLKVAGVNTHTSVQIHLDTQDLHGFSGAMALPHYKQRTFCSYFVSEIRKHFVLLELITKIRFNYTCIDMHRILMCYRIPKCIYVCIL